MSQRSISGKDLNEAVTSDDVLGKDVIDSDGKFIGIAEKVFIHPTSLDFMGIEVDKGFLKKGLSIGKDYIERIAKHAVFLNIRIAFEMRGMNVFSRMGENIGKVTDVELIGYRNEIKAIHVKYDGKDALIPLSFIVKIGEGVFLNVSKEELINFLEGKNVPYEFSAVFIDFLFCLAANLLLLIWQFCLNQ